jgi:hypothetical protein
MLLRAGYTVVQDDAGRIMTATLTPRQQQALADIFHAQQFIAPGAWITPDILNAGLRRTLSTLIPYGLVKGRQSRTARRTDYRLTGEGQRVAAEVFARLSDEAAIQTARTAPTM